MKFAIIILLLPIVVMAAIDRGPILSSQRPNCVMTVNFRTENLCVGEVHYRLLPDGLWRSNLDPTTDTLHHLEMYISPYSQYEYYVLADGDSSGIFSFWTAPEIGDNRDFNFCAYGDTRTGLVAHYVIIDHVMTCNPMFMVHTGDMIEDGIDTDDWDVYFSELCDWHDIAQSVPYFYAMGNHDDESPYFYEAIDLPCNNPAGTEAYSSFDWGRIHFFTMNSEIDYSVTSAQYAFLQNDLATASSSPNYDFLIGLVHRPFYSSGYHGREEDMAEVLEPLLETYGVDLVLQGHDHLYERTYPQDGVSYIVTGGGGAPPSPVFWWFYWTAYGYNLYHHLDFHYIGAEHKLTMHMHNYSNEIVDSLVLIASAVEIEEQNIPSYSRLSFAPNPFNSSCRIETGSETEIKIYNIAGNLIKRGYTENSVYDWTPGDRTPGGIYFVKAISGNDQSVISPLLYLK